MLTQLFELSWKDSNPHRRNQNPTCYHYTTRQSVCKTFFLFGSLAVFVLRVQRYNVFLF